MSEAQHPVYPARITPQAIQYAPDAHSHSIRHIMPMNISPRAIQACHVQDALRYWSRPVR
jgi:hypothetical protein